MANRGDPVLGAKLRQLRDDAGLSQVEVAAAVDRTRGHIAAIELGKRPVGRETLVKLANLYNKSLDFIASRLGEENGRTARNELEAGFLMAAREHTPEKAAAWLALIIADLPNKH